MGEPPGAPLGTSLLGIGIDSVDVHRFRRSMHARRGLSERLFTPAEREYAAGLLNPAPSLAARFAAKEAVMKALGVGLGAISWWDAEVLRLPGGQPQLNVTGRALALAEGLGVKAWLISLTHTAGVASAVVAALA